MKIKHFSFEWFPFLTTVILHSRITWSIRLRWLAIFGFFTVTLIAKYSFNIIVPYAKIWILLAILAVINIIYLAISKLVKEYTFTSELIILYVHIIIDLFILTFIVHYAGGIENPIYIFYLFHVILSSIVFPGLIPMVFASLIVVLFSLLTYLEYTGIIEHYSVFNTNIYINETAIYLLLLVFAVTVYVSAYICSTFMQIYRDVKRQIDAQNKMLVEADQQKTKFFQFASHELKSPIIAVKTSIDSVIKSISTEVSDKSIDILQRASVRSSQMLQIIKELLELSKNRSMVTVREGENIDVHAILSEVVNQEKIQANTKKIDIDVVLCEDRPIIWGKIDDYQKIFINLISNAVRYTSENGQIQIGTKIIDRFFQFEIEDNGIGIPEKDLKNIFGEFYRAENAKKIYNYGTGLGLSLVKQLIESYNGKIEVQSQIGQGTLFRVILPLSDMRN